MGKRNGIYSSCREAWLNPPPPGWSPSFEEEVWLPTRSPFLLGRTAIVIRTLGFGVVEVVYRSNGRKVKRQILASDLRPTGQIVEWHNSTPVLVWKDGRKTKRQFTRIARELQSV